MGNTSSTSEKPQDPNSKEKPNRTAYCHVDSSRSADRNTETTYSYTASELPYTSLYTTGTPTYSTSSTSYRTTTSSSPANTTNYQTTSYPGTSPSNQTTSTSYPITMTSYPSATTSYRTTTTYPSATASYRTTTTYPSATASYRTTTSYPSATTSYETMSGYTGNRSSQSGITERYPVTNTDSNNSESLKPPNMLPKSSAFSKPLLEQSDRPKPQPRVTTFTGEPPTRTVNKDDDEVCIKPESSSMAPPNTENGITQRIQRGFKILLLLRGLPGSGKSTLAKKLQYNGVILSDYSFFENDGVYNFNPLLLNEAVTQTQEHALINMQKRISPIIIDNNNLILTEMEPYIIMAVQHHYFITVLEPDTVWRYDAMELTKRNSHQLPYIQITRMLRRFHRGLTYNTMLRQILPKLAKQHQAESGTSNKEIQKEFPKAKNESEIHTKQQKKTKTAIQEKLPETEIAANDKHANIQQTSSEMNQNKETESSTNTQKVKKTGAKKKKKNVNKECPSTTAGPIQDAIPNANEAEKVKPMKTTKQIKIPSTTLIPLPCSPIQNVILSTDNKLNKDTTDAIDWDDVFSTFNYNSPKDVLSDNMRDLLLINFEVPPIKPEEEETCEPSSKGVAPRQELATTLKVADSVKPQTGIQATKEISTKSHSLFDETVHMLASCTYSTAGESVSEKHLSNEINSRKLTRTAASKWNLDSTGEKCNIQKRSVKDVVSETCEEFVLRIDLIFAMELERRFGPVGFRVLTDASNGNDLDVDIDLNTARKVHSLWSNSVMMKSSQDESGAIKTQSYKKFLMENQPEGDDDEDCSVGDE